MKYFFFTHVDISSLEPSTMRSQSWMRQEDLHLFRFRPAKKRAFLFVQRVELYSVLFFLREHQHSGYRHVCLRQMSPQHAVQLVYVTQVERGE